MIPAKRFLRLSSWRPLPLLLGVASLTLVGWLGLRQGSVVLRQLPPTTPLVLQEEATFPLPETFLQTSLDHANSALLQSSEQLIFSAALWPRIVDETSPEAETLRRLANQPTTEVEHTFSPELPTSLVYQPRQHRLSLRAESLLSDEPIELQVWEELPEAFVWGWRDGFLRESDLPVTLPYAMLTSGEGLLLLGEQNQLPPLSNWLDENPQPSDCSQDLPGEPAFAAQRLEQAEGAVLALNSTNHHACLSLETAFDPGQKSLLTLDVRRRAAGSIKLLVRLKADSGEVVFSDSQTVSPELNTWTTLQVPLPALPDQTARVELLLYAPSTGEQTRNEFRQPRLQYLKPVGEEQPLAELAPDPLLVSAPFDAQLFNPASQSSLLDRQNASFEQGLWSDAPSDCSNQRPGEPVFNQSLLPTGYDETPALELQSDNHLACVVRNFDLRLTPSRRYTFSLAAEGEPGQRLLVLLRLSGPDGSEDFRLDQEVTSAGWQTYTLPLISELKETERLRVYLYADGNHPGGSRWRFDQLRFVPSGPRDLSAYRITTRAEASEPIVAETTPLEWITPFLAFAPASTTGAYVDLDTADSSWRLHTGNSGRLAALSTALGQNTTTASPHGSAHLTNQAGERAWWLPSSQSPQIVLLHPNLGWVVVLTLAGLGLLISGLRPRRQP